MTRLMVVATSDLASHVTKALSLDGRIEVATTIGRSDDDYRATSVSRTKALSGKRGLITRHLENLKPLDQKPESLASDILLFCEHMARREPNANVRTHQLQNFHDYIDYYHLMTAAFRAEIEAERIDTVLFFNLPHLGYDTAAYLTARALGLRTIIVSQSQLPGRFFSMQNIEDFGYLRSTQDAPAMPVEKVRKDEFFYMAGVAQSDGEKGALSLKAFTNILHYLARHEPLNLLNPARIYTLSRKVHALAARFPKWRDPFARLFHADAFSYFETLAGFEDAEIDLSQPYVYFPLQLQPEMTTSTLGGRYNDQILAIETLRAKLPEDIRILVKENPKQGAFMRGPLAFHRLQALPNVEILPSFADTHALTANAKAVATISGSVGWEAIRQSVPVFLFGRAWYGDFPGVFRMEEEPNIAEVLASKIEHSALESAFGKLHASLHPGVVDTDYAQIAEGFDHDANRVAVTQALKSLLLDAEPKTSFNKADKSKQATPLKLRA